jgi:cytochrome c biogenesis protein ResB
MKPLWQFFLSPRLTIVLSLLIVADVLIGTFLLSAYGEVFGGIELEVFFFWLADTGIANLRQSWWIFLLLGLMSLLLLNTLACVIDSIAGAIAQRREGQAIARRLLSQVVHVGFVIVLTGHLVTSATGFRTTDNRLFEGARIAMPGDQGLSLRLDRLDVAYTEDGGMARMDAALSLMSGDRVIRQQVARLNRPLFYRGNAVYLKHHAEAPGGIRLQVVGNGMSETVRVMSGDPRGGRFGDYRIETGRVIPDFALDGAGKAYSASGEFRNPALELRVFKGGTEAARGWALLMLPDRRALALDGYELFFSGLEFLPYAVVSINRDYGASIALMGALLFLGALIMLLFVRNEGAELVPGRGGPRPPAAG